jgi:hypothetical protein
MIIASAVAAGGGLPVPPARQAGANAGNEGSRQGGSPQARRIG